MFALGWCRCRLDNPSALRTLPKRGSVRGLLQQPPDGTNRGCMRWLREVVREVVAWGGCVRWLREVAASAVGCVRGCVKGSDFLCVSGQRQGVVVPPNVGSAIENGTEKPSY